jgi:hypothetical protein
VPSSLIALALALSVQGEPSGKGDACTLPAALRDALQARFGTSRVLKAADLFEDERALFQKEHKGGCPGVGQGRFFGAKERPAFALVLVDVEPRKNVRLVIARPALSTWTFFEADDLDQGSTPVVGSKAPGTYTDFGRSLTRNSANEVVKLAGYESWERVYVWNGRAFEKLELTR